jgi:hypothetical protein
MRLGIMHPDHGKMKRISIRKDGRFVPVGWICNDCGQVQRDLKFSLVLGMNSTAPKNPMMKVTGRKIDGTSGEGKYLGSPQRSIIYIDKVSGFFYRHVDGRLLTILANKNNG